MMQPIKCNMYNNGEYLGTCTLHQINDTEDDIIRHLVPDQETKINEHLVLKKGVLEALSLDITLEPIGEVVNYYTINYQAPEFPKGKSTKEIEKQLQDKINASAEMVFGPSKETP